MLPQIDPKITFWLGVWTNVLVLIASLGVDHAPAAIAHYAPTVQWIAGTVAQINSVVLTAMIGISSTKAGPLVSGPTPPIPPAVVKVLIAAFLLSLFLPGGSAMAQIRKPHVTGNIGADLKADAQDMAQQGRAVVTGQPAADSTAPLACTFQMLTKLTPANLLPTINQCIATKLVADTQRALSSAEAYGTTGKGDADAVNCLTPALAIFQAGVEVPAVPAQDAVPAVLNADGSVKTPAIPAVAAVPAQEPGPILLYQKYREFTLSGALTSCQSWFNGPINATVAAGLGAASTAIGGAALLAPLK